MAPKATYRVRGRARREAGARIAATEAAKNFGQLVSRVREEGATYVIERGGKPVARIGPAGVTGSTMAALKALVAARPPVDQAYLRAVERAVRKHNAPRVRQNPWER
jgi:antitoxin (DNA-binding transcriptional repressor) of toxin-antitoxin stability system